MESVETNLFDEAMSRYQAGAKALDVLKDFETITTASPNHSSGWTCLAWLQLLVGQNEEALRSARIAVKLNSQDPQARINLSLALLETKSKGVREHVEVVKKILFAIPDFQEDLKSSIEDGLSRKPNWDSLQKIKEWLEF